MNFDFIAGFVGGGLAAFLAPLVMDWWDKWMSDDADPLDDPKNRQLRALADCDSRAGEPLGKCMRRAASALSSQSLSLSEAREEIERLKGLVAGIREAPQEPWQDIATAPKDGTWVELYRPPPPEGRWESRITARWFNFEEGEAAWAWPDQMFSLETDDERWRAEELIEDGDCYEDALNFTHWRRLTPAPLGSGRSLADANTNPASTDLSSLRKGAEVAGWQPMSTAPRDGKHCILSVPSGAFFYSVQGAFQNGQWNAVHQDNVNPVAWMPNVLLPDHLIDAALVSGSREDGADG